jgi:hypothetical protein
VTTSSQTPPLVEEETTFENTKNLGKNKNMAMGPEIKIDHAGESGNNLPDRPTDRQFFAKPLAYIMFS